MAREIGEAPEAIARFFDANLPAIEDLGRYLRADPPVALVTCARGSSDHAALWMRSLVEIHCGVLSASLSPSVSSVYGAQLRLRRTFCVAISQSGASPDLVSTATMAAAAGARTLGLINTSGSPLAAAVDQVLPMCAGPELSVAATKSCLVSLAAGLMLAACWSGDQDLRQAALTLPQARAAGLVSPSLSELGEVRSIFVIGRGPGLAIASEAALKLKETCGLPAEAISAAEVRHGPLAVAGGQLAVLTFDGGDAASLSIRRTADDLESMGARVIRLTDPATHPAQALLLQLFGVYGACERLSRDMGHDPDRPGGLQKVTRTT